MELLLISDSKLKVMLSAADMRKYEIDCETIDYDNTETRRAFWSILDEAKHRTGFDAASDKVFVQVYPSKGGGCEMYVTKLGIYPLNEEEKEEDGAKNISKKYNFVPAALSTPARRSYSTVYRFDCIDSLLSVCKRLKMIDFCGESAAYTAKAEMPNTHYYLVLEEKIPLGKMHSPAKGRLSFISEYGRAVNLYGIHSYIKEHCRPICECGAVESLHALC